MTTDVNRNDTRIDAGAQRRWSKKRMWAAAGISALGAAAAAIALSHLNRAQATAGAPSPLSVTVSAPLQRELGSRQTFLGQLSAVERVELRAQVGGTLTEIDFVDGAVVRKGDLLFVIDPVPYEIKLAQASAQLATARARFDLAVSELKRAEALKGTNAGTAQNVEQRIADKLAAQAAVESGNALVRDARFDLDHCRITAPFTGRIGTHLISLGNLVSGSRAGSSPTTLLTTLVSLDPIYVDFDMSEAEYMVYQRERAATHHAEKQSVHVALTDETDFARTGTLDFLDNSMDRSSGTIRARATVANKDALLTPGAFARVRLDAPTAQQTLLVPDASVLADQSDHVIPTVNDDNVVVPKKVELGELRGGLRVVRSGLIATDRVVIDGIPFAAPGSKVTPVAGSITFAADKD